MNRRSLQTTKTFTWGKRRTIGTIGVLIGSSGGGKTGTPCELRGMTRKRNAVRKKVDVSLSGRDNEQKREIKGCDGSNVIEKGCRTGSRVNH